MAKVAQARKALTEVEQLRKENADLRARVDELEAQLAARPRKTAPAKAQQ